MQNTKFSLTPSLSEFLSNYRLYGFKNRTAMIQTALLRFKKELELENLRQSADSYSESYDEDSDISQSVEQFLEKWTGFIKDIDPDKNKLEYLQKKYL
ncbi:MAG: hypothetical protein HQK64_13960 [Desulfamplus sp.]|nr:hypothetical protein [Desulfamplus sp.]